MSAPSSTEGIRPDFYQKALSSILACNFKNEEWNPQEKLWLLSEVQKYQPEGTIRTDFVISRYDLFAKDDREHITWALKNYPSLVQEKCKAVLRFPQDKEILDLARPHLEPELLDILALSTGVEDLSSLKIRFEKANLQEFSTMIESILTDFTEAIESARMEKIFDAEQEK